MRRIVKGPEPEELRAWKQENELAPQNVTYGNMPKNAVKLQMLVEQGYLCAYTMQRISTADDCHIEHITPQHQPDQQPYADIDYNNLLACIPSNTPGYKPQVENFPYGAVRKGGALITPETFVSPLVEGVENRFQYLADGCVNGPAGDVAANNTIELLDLNHDQLKDLRKAALEERVLDIGLTADEARHVSDSISLADIDGRIPEFCIAIAQVARWYANTLRRNEEAN